MLFFFFLLQDIHESNNAENNKEDDWKAAFNKKAKHQTEIKDNNHGMHV